MHVNTISISTTVRGPIWWPCGQVATMDRQERFALGHTSPFHKEWHSLREALITLTEQGDFQHCLIDHSIHMTFHGTDDRGNDMTTSRYIDTPPKSVADLWADEED